jgi:hypothetical protein
VANLPPKADQFAAAHGPKVPRPEWGEEASDPPATPAPAGAVVAAQDRRMIKWAFPGLNLYLGLR